MSTEPNTTTVEKAKFNWTPLSRVWEDAKFYAKTLIVLVFIINSVALALNGFGIIDLDRETTSILGAVAASYATIVLFSFVHNGVKSGANNKRKR